jgi:hypothetical protein
VAARRTGDIGSGRSAGWGALAMVGAGPTVALRTGAGDAESTPIADERDPHPAHRGELVGLLLDPLGPPPVRRGARLPVFDERGQDLAPRHGGGAPSRVGGAPSKVGGAPSRVGSVCRVGASGGAPSRGDGVGGLQSCGLRRRAEQRRPAELWPAAMHIAGAAATLRAVAGGSVQSGGPAAVVNAGAGGGA